MMANGKWQMEMVQKPAIPFAIFHLPFSIIPGSERIRHPPINVLPRFIAPKGVVAGEEDAVARDERQVAGDLPVEEKVRLPAEITIVAGQLIDRRVFVELV